MLAKLDDAGLALIRGHEIRHFLPSGNDAESLGRIRDDRRGRGERNGSATSRSDLPKHLGARCTIERLDAPIVERVHVYRVCAGVHSGTGRVRDGRRGARRCCMNPVATESGLQEDGRMHSVQYSSAPRLSSACDWMSPILPNMHSKERPIRRAPTASTSLTPAIV